MRLKAFMAISKKLDGSKTFDSILFTTFFGTPCTKRYNKEVGKLPEELVEWESVGGEPQEEQNAELLSGLLSWKSWCLTAMVVAS